MVLGYVMTGMTTGALIAGMGLFAGSPLWVAVLLYSLGGTIGMVALATLICVFPRGKPEAAEPGNKTVASVAEVARQ